MLMRFDPFQEIDRKLRRAASPTMMAMDAYRDGDSFVVRFDLPGVDPNSIDLTVEKNVLTVSADRSWQPSDEQEVIASERPQGTFRRQLFLGDALDAEHVSASYRDGVLTLTIPTAPQAKPRKVSITTGASGSQEAMTQDTDRTQDTESAKESRETASSLA